ncbi:uncharacterized protein K489DRAFT_413896 [Dissoconium aciculare CBS 342.82]|uniref:F-box domain-containing protein n=1 Tax=Dissoconium aciculare CBS 342.82 TaxID=1314786 RepID=A0A6J3LQX4_9PEZI|nr:uncharacterized protein K489DRAFT_413896 [Dissoconium aciculare CBS 342.82]KAF1818266.1 hypothetical protein K489DRAFT_413896 [Dissoconium aciculare CBS 342.82]
MYLPTELILQIAKHCDFESLKSLRYIGPEFDNVVISLVFEHITLRTITEEMIDQLELILQNERIRNRIKRLTWQPTTIITTVAGAKNVCSCSLHLWARLGGSDEPTRRLGSAVGRIVRECPNFQRVDIIGRESAGRYSHSLLYDGILPSCSFTTDPVTQLKRITLQRRDSSASLQPQNCTMEDLGTSDKDLNAWNSQPGDTHDRPCFQQFTDSIQRFSHLRHLNIELVKPNYNQTLLDWTSIYLPYLEAINISNMSFELSSMRHLLLTHYDSLHKIELSFVGIAYTVGSSNDVSIFSRWSRLLDDLAGLPRIKGGPSIFRMRKVGYHGYKKQESFFAQDPNQVWPEPCRGVRRSLSWPTVMLGDKDRCKDTWVGKDTLSWYRICGDIISQRCRRGMDTTDFEIFYSFPEDIIRPRIVSLPRVLPIQEVNGYADDEDDGNEDEASRTDSEEYWRARLS